MEPRCRGIGAGLMGPTPMAGRLGHQELGGRPGALQSRAVALRRCSSSGGSEARGERYRVSWGVRWLLVRAAPRGGSCRLKTPYGRPGLSQEADTPGGTAPEGCLL